jgi:LysM repeat protein
MAFARARIEPEDQPPIEVLFNPTQYSLEKSNQIAEIGVPGLGAPILQYVRGNARSLTMDLFFDTYEQQADVRQHTDRIYGLLRIDGTRHRPPICTFIWGNFRFRCVLERVSGRFTLFLADGRPVRATLSVTLKEFTEVALLVKDPPTESADHVKIYRVKRGDTLSSIAAAEYGSPALWRPIADANRIHDPLALAPGDRLVLPALR